MKADQLTERLRKAFPDADVRLTNFASGAADIAIYRGDRCVVIQYVSGAGYGVSLLDRDAAFEGHDHVVVDEAAAFACAAELLQRSV